MSLHYIIDGYNIIKHPKFVRHPKKLEEGRNALVRLIADKKLCGSPKNKATIVFDGANDVFAPRLAGPCEIIFTKNESADEKIKKLVAAEKNPRQVVVVSDDKEIIFFIRSLGASPLGVSEFLGEKEKSPPRPRQEVTERKLTYSEAAKINEELKKIWLN
ncbi:MAG: NYN domain-containing protein [Candidatus Omnitrophica bacterium]|nr:NYN domain-containing protein [Candidatus Omnitrophota bacterium]MDD5236344.1 NYN domain-containing protein [Candidatus Omnitrophota bacterium]MDD5610226.1 NYN domain-containing protein [Candidatus Omnitrophota bacterium]